MSALLRTGQQRNDIDDFNKTLKICDVVGQQGRNPKRKHGGDDIGVMDLFSCHRILPYSLQQLIGHCRNIVKYDQIILKTTHIFNQRDNGNFGGQRETRGRNKGSSRLLTLLVWTNSGGILLNLSCQ